ncbi:MAG: GatB/YqeY domain-containing protein [Chitinophagales bacterium]|jgi:hypothetical protein|nr:GatB/YqeY domain-containing protein [Chitinophagales bacterium]
MSLEENIMTSLKEAMKAKDEVALRTLRAIKGELLKAKTEKEAKEIDLAREIKILQTMIKQRQDSITIYQKENLADLIRTESEEIEVIKRFLPQQLSPSELREKIQTIILNTGAKDLKDLGKVIGQANQELMGKADNKSISDIAKEILTT